MYTFKKFPGLFDRCFEFFENKAACQPFKDGYYVLEYDVIFKVDTRLDIVDEKALKRAEKYKQAMELLK